MFLPVTKINSTWNSVQPRHQCLSFCKSPHPDHSSLHQKSENFKCCRSNTDPTKRLLPPRGQDWKFWQPHFAGAAPLQPHSHWGSDSDSSESNPEPRHQTAASKSGFVYLIRSKANHVLCFSLPVKYTTCNLLICVAVSKSTHLLSLTSTDQYSEVSKRGLNTNLVALEETEYLLHSCVIWQALHPDQGSRLGQDRSVGGSGSSCHSSWRSCNVPHRGRRHWRTGREREQNCYKKPLTGATTQNR